MRKAQCDMLEGDVRVYEFVQSMMNSKAMCGFQVWLGVIDRTGSQKMDSKWASVWKARCKDFFGKMKEGVV